VNSASRIKCHETSGRVQITTGTCLNNLISVRDVLRFSGRVQGGEVLMMRGSTDRKPRANNPLYRGENGLFTWGC
jgi:hypothetical protein